VLGYPAPPPGGGGGGGVAVWGVGWEGTGDGGVQRRLLLLGRGGRCVWLCVSRCGLHASPQMHAVYMFVAFPYMARLSVETCTANIYA
jgi:hypothetical protein